MAVKTFGFIEKFGFEDRFRRPGQHPQWILPVEQQRPDAVFGRAAVGNSVVERQPPCLGQDRRRASADLLLPGSFAAGDKQMAGLVLPCQQVVGELQPDRRVFHPVTFAHELFGTVHHGELPADFLREKDHVPIVEHGRRKPPQPAEIPEVGRHGKPRISQILRHGGRRISSASGQTHHVVRESPVLPGGMGAVGVGNVKLIVELHDARIFDAPSVGTVRAGTEYRRIADTAEVEAVLADGQPQTDDMFLVVAGGAVEHVKPAVVVDDPRVAGYEILPGIGRIGSDDRIFFVFLQFHINGIL